ncbi:hypothetical protein [Caviibacter abscessus]|uniref:hypothetical protein n=1 Tax=Caviibacter abscessus TaxID=1766719 RepID=UPI00082F6B33|nr:hypothetical protein [Caviibacter abscessus]
MKKFLLLIILNLGLISFALKFNDTKYWYDLKYLPELTEYLNPGDVIILTPSPGIVKTGHALMVNKEKKFIDFPDLYIGYRETIPEALVDPQRKFAVFRYKYMTEEMSNKMFDYIYKNYLNNQYMLTFKTGKHDYTYCTLFVYDVFNHHITDPAKKIPLFEHFILPVDFIGFGDIFDILNFDNIVR